MISEDLFFFTLRKAKKGLNLATCKSDLEYNVCINIEMSMRRYVISDDFAFGQQVTNCFRTLGVVAAEWVLMKHNWCCATVY